MQGAEHGVSLYTTDPIEMKSFESWSCHLLSGTSRLLADLADPDAYIRMQDRKDGLRSMP